MTTIVLQNYEWNKLRLRIEHDYGITTLLSWRLKERLGFTARHHSGKNHLTGVYENDTRLDFVDEAAATFFRMKYL